MPKKNKLLLFILFLTIKVAAQGNLSGKVMTLDNNPIANAIVQLMNGDTIVSYTSTKADGSFLLKYNELGNYSIEINAFNFEKLVTEIVISSNDFKVIELKLFPETKKLDEVTIIGKSAAIKEDGDKLTYNLGTFTNGSEKSLKDIINKLPGMEVDANGKIKANGKVVDKLLIDGEEFFGDNHQLATENISADMIDGIDLLNHFENNSSIKDIESSDKKAINIAIKKSYKGKIKGNLSALSGYENRYSAKTNLFRFDKKSNLSFIGNLNNINEQAITVEQYYNMNNSIKNEIKNNEITNSSATEDLPSNLISNDFVIEKKTKFGALNFSVFPSANFKINGFSIVNETIQKELIQNNTNFIENSNFNAIENTNTKGNYLFNQTKINVDYRLSATSFISYSALFEPKIDETNKNIEQKQTTITKDIIENSDNKKISFGQQISYINRLSKNKLLTLNVFNELKNNIADYELETNKNLFTINSNLLLQDQKFKTLENGFLSKLAIKKNNLVYIFGFSYYDFNQNYNSSLKYNNNEIKNDLTSTRKNFATDFGFYKRNGKFQFSFLNKFKYFNSFKTTTNFFYVPQFQIKYEFKPTHYLSTSYNRTVKFTDEDKLFSNQVIQNYNSLINDSQLTRNKPITNNSFGLNYLYIHLFSGTILFATVNYAKYNNTIVQDFTQEQDFSITNYRINEEQNNLSTNVVFERKIKFIKSRIKTEFSFSNVSGLNFLSNLENPFDTKIYVSKISLLSYFKKQINYSIGFENQSILTNYEKLNLKNKTQKQFALTAIDGKINENLKYNISNSYQIFEVTDTSIKFNKTDFEFTYDNEKNDWSYFIKGNDIFNIKSNQIIETNLTNNLEQTKIRSRIPGFIALGMKYTL